MLQASLLHFERKGQSDETTTATTASSTVKSDVVNVQWFARLLNWCHTGALENDPRGFAGLSNARCSMQSLQFNEMKIFSVKKRDQWEREAGSVPAVQRLLGLSLSAEQSATTSGENQMAPHTASRSPGD